MRFARRSSFFAFALRLGVAAGTLFFLPDAFCAPVALELPPETESSLRPLLESYLHLDDSSRESDDSERETRRLRLLRDARSILATEGYFSPQFRWNDASSGPQLRITPGPRTTVSEVHLALTGALPEARKREIEASWSLVVGQPFRQADWDRAKEQVLLSLIERDFPAARLVASNADIDADLHRATLSLTLDSGPLYRFGSLRIDGLNRYPATLVDRYDPGIEPGLPYREDLLLDLQSTLENTPYFASVRAHLDLNASSAEADGSRRAPVRVYLREEAPHRVGLGAGVSSNTGLRMEANFETADWLHRAWQLQSGLKLEQLQQAFYADVFLPPSRAHDSQRRHRDAFGLQLKKSNIQDLELDTASLALNRQQRWQNGDLTLSLGYLAEAQRPQHQKRELTRALTLNAAWSRAYSFGNGSGGLTQLQLGGAGKPVSSQNFVRLYGRQQFSFRLNARNTVNLRAEGGIVLAKARKGVPQHFLFRAGGSGSVRGYAYQSLGVKDGDAIVGGRYLLAASAEWVHWLPDSPWGIALFSDLGNADDDRNAFHLNVGYGIGARWNSPAGPLGIDLAHGDQWRLHFAIAIPF